MSRARPCRSRFLAALLIAVSLGACATRPASEPAAAEQTPPPRSTTVAEALQFTGGLIKSVLGLFSVGVIVR
jgi:hypothetical protein